MYCTVPISNINLNPNLNLNLNLCCAIPAEAGSVTGGSLTAASVLVAAGGAVRMDKLTGLSMTVGQGSPGPAGSGGSVHIGAVYCEQQLHVECQGAAHFQ